MIVKIFRKPIFHIIFEDFFDREIAKLIRFEAKHQQYEEATTFGGIVKQIRDNNIVYYDNIYKDKRDQSVLLSAFATKFQEDMFKEIMSSCPFPFNEFIHTDYHETQVSTYNKHQRYKWHVDRYENYMRIISLGYYFFKEPKQFKGGEFVLTSSPVCDGKLIEESSLFKNNIKKISLKNNMAIVFDSTVGHQVLPANSKDLEYQRYSAQIWIGKRDEKL